MSDRDREREREIDKRVLYFVVSKSWWCFSFVMKAIIYERERERAEMDVAQLVRLPNGNQVGHGFNPLHSKVASSEFRDMCMKYILER